MISEDLLRSTVAVGTAWALYASRRAWIGPRLCPRAPLFPGWPELPYSQGVYPALLALLLLIAAGTPVATPLFVVLAGWGCLADWTRFRPYLYQNSAILMALVLASQPLHTARLITVSVYFWAGLLKANRTFFKTTFAWITEPLRRKLPRRWRPRARRFATAIPLLEAGLGFGLLVPSTRPLACAGAVAMHGFILLCFAQESRRHYHTITPWNVTMAASTVLLFACCPDVGPREILLGGGDLFHLTILGLFTVLPCLGLLNWLDPVFTHGHMTGRHMGGALALSPALRSRLPESMQRLCKKLGWGAATFYVLEIGEWYLSELHIPAPQQERLLRTIARDFARYGATDRDLKLTVVRLPGTREETPGSHTYSWSEL